MLEFCLEFFCILSADTLHMSLPCHYAADALQMHRVTVRAKTFPNTYTVYIPVRIRTFRASVSFSLKVNEINDVSSFEAIVRRYVELAVAKKGQR